MNSQSTADCLLCSDYLLGLLNEEEQLQFENHLQYCEVCQSELAEIQPAISVLPLMAEQVPLPPELKGKTLQAAFAAKPSVQNTRNGQHAADFKRITAWGSFFSNRFGKLAAGLVAILTIALTASLYQLNEYKEQIQTAPIDRPAPTTKVDRFLPLYSTNQDTQVSGVAYLTETSEGIQVVVQVQNAPSLTGEQAFQVWIFRNGQRINAGTFRVNESGAGILVFTSGSVTPNIEQIGITLEPDANGTEPRGPKVLGTKI